MEVMVVLGFVGNASGISVILLRLVMVIIAHCPAR